MSGNAIRKIDELFSGSAGITSNWRGSNGCKAAVVKGVIKALQDSGGEGIFDGGVAKIEINGGPQVLISGIRYKTKSCMRLYVGRNQGDEFLFKPDIIGNSDVSIEVSSVIQNAEKVYVSNLQ